MDKNKVNELIKARIGFSDDKEIEDYRNTYLNIIKESNEEDFYNSIINWFFDGNAPYYDRWLERNWR